jgi:hypothetical protein
MKEGEKRKPAKKKQKEKIINDTSSVSLHLVADACDDNTTVSAAICTDESFDLLTKNDDISLATNNEDDEEPQEVLGHSMKHKEITLTVRLKNNQEIAVPLWAAWADYPDLVKKYRSQNKLCKNKRLMIPREKDCATIVFIQGHQGDPITRPSNATC